MKVISIKQPLAQLIVNGTSNVINRTWKMKIDNNICNNWVLVHSSGKFENIKNIKPLIYKKIKLLNWKKYPTASIIGMIHINYTDSNYNINNLWETGPICWYMDAVIEFKNSIKCKGKYGIWDPPIYIHDKLQKEILNSIINIKMHTCKYKKINDDYIDNISLFKNRYIFKPDFVNYIIGINKYKNIKIITEYFNILPVDSTIIINSSLGLNYLNKYKLFFLNT